MKMFIKHMLYGFSVFFLINILIAFIYEYPAYKAIKNKTHKNYLKWNSIHNNKNAYDLIILGSSRSYNGYNPKILDEKLNLESFNMGTSAQDIAESYYTLKEILEYQNPKYVVLETYFDLSDNTHDFYQIFSNASFFNSKNNKYNLITEGYGTKGICNYLIPLMRFNNYIKQDLISFISNKPKKNPNQIWYKGFATNTRELTNMQIKALMPVSDFTNTSFNKKRFKNFMNKINKLTKSKGIELIVVRNPYPPARLRHKNKTNDEENFYKKYFQNFKDVGYYDLNNYKQERYKYEDSDFSDHHHVNYKGSKKMSHQLVDIILNNSQ